MSEKQELQRSGKTHVFHCGTCGMDLTREGRMFFNGQEWRCVNHADQLLNGFQVVLDARSELSEAIADAVKMLDKSKRLIVQLGLEVERLKKKGDGMRQVCKDLVKQQSVPCESFINLKQITENAKAVLAMESLDEAQSSVG